MSPVGTNNQLCSSLTLCQTLQTIDQYNLLGNVEEFVVNIAPGTWEENLYLNLPTNSTSNTLQLWGEGEATFSEITVLMDSVRVRVMISFCET